MSSITFADVEAAAARIAPHAHRTPVLASHSIDDAAGCRIVFKCENFQRVGAFKFRGACNAVWSLDDAVAKRGVVTHSSGNHGAAVALAAKTRGIPAHVVVPGGSNAAKVAGIKVFGAKLYFCAPTLAARDEMAERIARETGATLIHPFTHPHVIAGQGTAARELLEEVPDLDAIVTPIGGGGLIGGTSIVARGIKPGIRLFGAEPEGASDAFESLRAGERRVDLEPKTISDGLRATIGAINFDLLREFGVEVVMASDAETVAAMRLMWERLKIIVEPSSAVALAAILRNRDRFAGLHVGVIVTGGNVDLDQLPWKT
ncbi:MAG TPA: pyridoxal-phosphate dependent enzyme [Rudaea sp.]|jgi:threonine dehydratase|nr:pyridoxal-phosphate dependent enzyme [Rudaea sp.]